jgi:hypothetical protein
MILHHLTINTGDLHRSRRWEVQQHVIDFLLPLVDAEGAYFPGIELAFFIARNTDLNGTPIDGSAFFQIAPETGDCQTPYVMCIGCWLEEASETAWLQLGSVNLSQRAACEPLKIWKPLPPKRPPVPWLGVVLTPFMARLDQERVGMLGDFERSLFWALAEGSGS